MNKTLTVAALTLAVAGLASTGAKAQSTITPNLSDLVLGFEVTDNAGTGAPTNLEVDLGDTSLFTKTAQINLTGATGLTAADLSSTYGSTWNTRTDLTWGVAGITDTAAITGASDYLLTSSSANATLQAALSAAESDISNLTIGIYGATSTANSSEATTIGTSSTTAKSTPYSWTYEQTSQDTPNLNGTLDFDSYSPAGVTTLNNGVGGALGTLDLYSFTQGGATTKDGYFTLLDTGGTLSFTYTGVNALAAPEPSAYALGLCAVVLFFVLRRRQMLA